MSLSEQFVLLPFSAGGYPWREDAKPDVSPVGAHGTCTGRPIWAEANGTAETNATRHVPVIPRTTSSIAASAPARHPSHL